MRKFLLSFLLGFLSLFFIFNYSTKAWTLHDNWETSAIVEENPPLPTQVFLPMIAGNSVMATTHSTAIDSDADWSRYAATYYSFGYPSERDVKEQNGGQYVLLTAISDHAEGGKIEFAYLGFEITEKDDLLEWYDRYTRAGLGEIPERKILERSSYEAPDGSIVRKLHEQHESGGNIIQAVLITHGNLVLSLNAYTDHEAMTTLLKRIADTLEFNQDAPQSLADLFPGSPPTVTTLDQLQESLKPPVDVPIALATISTQEETPDGMPIPPSVPHSEEFIRWEQISQQLRNNSDASESVNGEANFVQAAGQVVPERQALPPEFASPVVPNVNVGCSSTYHTGRSAYAIDIEVPTGTTVTAVNDAYVSVSAWVGDWGYLIRAYSDVSAAGGTRRYWHNYAHLSFLRVAAGNNVSLNDSIADSGATGNTQGAHLHFHMTRDVNFNDGVQHPVDLSPLASFRPNLNYPTSGICGATVGSSVDPIIIEPVAYTQAYQPRSDHSWNCSTFYTNQHTTECYMAVVPLTNWGIDPLVTTQSPELRYARTRAYWPGNYYIWLCGRGGTPDDDSVYMGVNGTSPASAQRIEGYNQSVFVWKSIKMDGQRPYIAISSGLSVVNLWAREDGMRVDRILLTRDVNYNPSGNIRCGGY